MLCGFLLGGFLRVLNRFGLGVLLSGYIFLTRFFFSRQGLGGHDVNVPAAHLDGQSHVLPLPADGQGYLVLGHGNDGALGVLSLLEGNLQDIGRFQAGGDQGLGRFAPGDDVYLLAFHPVDYTLDAGAAHADARADAVNPGVQALDGDLGAQAWLARDLAKLNYPVGHLGDLDFEEPLDQLAAGPREEYPHKIVHLAHVQDDGAQALARLVMLAGYLLRAGEYRLRLAHVDDDGAALETLNRPVYQRANLLDVLRVDGLAFGFPDLLGDDLLGGLRRDPAQHFRPEALLALDRGHVARFPIDLNCDIFVSAEMLPGRRLQCALDGLEDDFLVDVFVTVQTVDESQYLFALHFDHPEAKKTCCSAPGTPRFRDGPHQRTGSTSSSATGHSAQC